MPRKKPSIEVGRYRVVKTADAPRDSVHLHLVPADVAGDPLKELHFAKDLALGAVILPIPKALAAKFPSSKVYMVSLREEP